MGRYIDAAMNQGSIWLVRSPRYYADAGQLVNAEVTCIALHSRKLGSGLAEARRDGRVPYLHISTYMCTSLKLPPPQHQSSHSPHPLICSYIGRYLGM